MSKTFVDKAKRNGTRADWHVYILECADGTLYTGSTNDLARRVREHNESALGAKYTKARRPVALRYESAHESRGAALKEEARIKALSRPGKQALLSLKRSLKKKS